MPEEELHLYMLGAGPRRPGSSRRRSDGTPSKRDTPPRRTTFHEDGMHVGTIVEHVDDNRNGHDFCAWYTAGGGDHAPDFATAEAQLRADILR